MSSYHLSVWKSWSEAVSRLTSMPWCYHLPLLEDNTQQCRLAEFKKNPINQEFSGKEFQFNLPKEDASCTSLKHVRVRGLRDCGTGLLRLDRDSYWVHSSLGSDKGLRASDESDNGSCPWLSPMVLGFAKEMKGNKVMGGKGMEERTQVMVKLLVFIEFN